MKKFNKTLSIALAVGVSLGGVQVVGLTDGMFAVAEASAANISASNVTATVITDGGDDLMAYPRQEVRGENR